MDSTITPGKPASRVVGTSGSPSKRSGLATARARSLPALMKPNAAEASPGNICTSLDSRAVTAGAAPL
ncbi:hypothetical protein D3C73_1257640 [compost metagenome]